MSKMIILSNRVAIPHTGAQAGGLAVALNEVLKQKGGIWCGWSGEIRESVRTCTQTHGNTDFITADITEADYKNYYLGFSNSLLWPLFHYQIGLTHYSETMYASYKRVNQHFAHLVAKHAQPDDVIWVHDYHLLLCGSYLRAKQVTSNIGFFLHIPFPVPEVMGTLPVYREIIEGMCAYDLLGFQTETDVGAFLRCVSDMGGSYTSKSGSRVHEVSAFGRTFKAGCFPISIDTEELTAEAEVSQHSVEATQVRESLNNRQLMIGVDRMDYTKGLPARVEAFGQLLEMHPEWNRKLSYLQITPPSRTDVEEYKDLREKLEGLAAHINGEHGECDWVPLRYLTKNFTRHKLSAMYRLARVGLVTPLRDGMNLVAKEYVASQDPADPGVLVLSEFAGAAQELKSALLVNPFDTQGMAKAMHRALTMPLKERKERYQEMMDVLKQNSIFDWTRSFLNQLNPLEDDGNVIEVNLPLRPTVRVKTPEHTTVM